MSKITLSNDELEEMCADFKALSDPGRMKIILFLSPHLRVQVRKSSLLLLFFDTYIAIILFKMKKIKLSTNEKNDTFFC